MSDEYQGYSTANDIVYPVRADEQGNDPLTGVKDNGKKDTSNRFTA